MKIGVPKEIKIHEYRVGLVPAGVRELVDAGHQVLGAERRGRGHRIRGFALSGGGRDASRRARPKSSRPPISS